MTVIDRSYMWLGIDIGTGGTRALLVDEQGHVRACVHGSARRHAHGAAAVGRAAAGELVGRGAGGDSRRAGAERAFAARDVRGVGLSGQMHGLVMLDAANQVIRPSLIWCDQRSQPQVDCDQRNSWAARTSCSSTANPVLTGFTLPKLLWVRDHEPREFRARAQDAAAQGLRALPADRRVCAAKFRTPRARRCSMW